MRSGSVTATRVVAVMALMFGGVVAVPGAVGAGIAAYDVTSLADSGAGSLRQALLDASDDAADDVVTVDPALAGGTVTLTTGELVHAGDDEALTIQGGGITVDAAGASRVLRHASTGLLTIEDLTITGGKLDETDEVEVGFQNVVGGAGVDAGGDVVLRRSEVTGNRIEGSDGGLGPSEDYTIRRARGAGVHAIGKVTLEDTHLTANRISGAVDAGSGAGSWSDAFDAFTSTVADNAIETGGFEGLGAGVATNTFSMIESELSRNVVTVEAIAFGGGVSAELGRVEDSLVEGNEAAATWFVAGGGLQVLDLEILSSTVRANVARSIDEEQHGRISGGAALFVGVRIVDSVFEENSAIGPLVVGGALGTDYVAGIEEPLPRSIVDSTFRANVAESIGDDYALGGVLAADGFTIQRSLFVENVVRSPHGAFGGAVMTTPAEEGPAAPMTIEDSTFIGNAAESYNDTAGGAVSAESADVSVVRSTFVDNIADEGSAVGVPSWPSDPVTIDVAGSVLRGASSVCGADVTVGAFVVATDGSCAGASVVADVGLGGLADNGGVTETLEPLPGSPLIDAIPAADALCVGFDQRGVDRPVGPACDIGAVETTDPMRVVGGWDARLAAGDLDGDEVDDLLGHRPGAAGDGVAWNGAPPAFGGFAVQGDYAPLVGDFDGDGVDDVFWYGVGSRADHVWWGDGDRSFTPTPTSVNGIYRPVVGDLDGDGVDDVFWYGVGSRADHVWWGDGDRSFTATSTSVNGVYEPFSGDFDGDGAGDIVWYAPGGSADYVWWGDGDRSFTSTATRLNGDYATTTGDYDVDGFDDIVFHGAGAGSDSVWWGGAGRGFVSVSRTIAGTHALVSGDFDGDKVTDLYLHGAGDAADRLHRGSDRGSFLTG